MKKLNILTAILFLPLLAAAYTLEPEFLEELNTITPIIENTVNDIQQEQKQEQEQKTKINKRLLNSCKKVIEESKAEIIFKRVNDNGISNIKVSGLFCDVDYIKTNLPKEIKEESNLPTLKALAEYIVQDNPEQNDFEILLAIGIEPLEAFNLTKDYCEVKLNEADNTIIYKHFERLYIGYSKTKMSVLLSQDIEE